MGHRRSDPDAFSGVYWGWKVFGGCTLVHSPRRAVLNVMRKLGFEPRDCDGPLTVISYDTNRLEDLPRVPDRLILVDHHPWMDPKLERLAWKVIRRPRACLAMNLYDMSREAGLDLPEDVLLTFALALVTDTAILRTAGSEELEYLSRFMKGRKMEEILELAFGGVVDPRGFAQEVLSVEKVGRICFGHFENDDHFLFFVDTFMYVMECEIVIGRLDWGVWVYSKKHLVQKVYPILKEMELEGYRRRGGRLFGLGDVDLILERLSGIF